MVGRPKLHKTPEELEEAYKRKLEANSVYQKTPGFLEARRIKQRQRYDTDLEYRNKRKQQSAAYRAKKKVYGSTDLSK